MIPPLSSPVRSLRRRAAAALCNALLLTCGLACEVQAQEPAAPPAATILSTESIAPAPASTTMPAPQAVPQAQAVVPAPAQVVRLEQARVISVTRLAGASPDTKTKPADGPGADPKAGEAAAPSYQVVYEYGGRQYSVLLPQDPGPYVTLQVPVTAAVMPAAPAAPAAPASPAAPAVAAVPAIPASPTAGVVVSTEQAVVVVPAPVYVAPLTVFPSVWWGGVLYRPLPYVGVRPIIRGGGHGHRGGRR